eukprot:TRINITY_DN5542_c0_g1_i1.p1 TRINITY_DN5542_c0_g1~~TRINITY_DN5542_c0_g1_i1.p1  ORF type:complete len:286 (-),score=67.19 TRINITY_DN5542_c0_g1_i1:87-944(-)
MSNDLVTFGSLYAAATLPQAIAMIYYMHFEITSFGFHAIKANKFVMITLAGNLTLFLDLLGLAMQNLSTRKLVIDAANGLSFINILLSCTCHIALVYLRTEAVFRFSPNFLKTIKGLMIATFIAGILCTILGLVRNISNSLLDSFVLFGIVAVTCFGVIDVISTYSFARFVIESEAQVKGNMFSKSDYQVRNINNTHLIARRSAVICFCAGVSVALFWAGWAVLYANNFGNTLASNTIFLLQKYFFLAAMMLWMWLKIGLDVLNKAPNEAPNSESLLDGSEEQMT